MNYSDLRVYLGLDHDEFEQLLDATPPAQHEAWMAMAQVSDNLEQLPSRYNRPPETADYDPVHDALEATSEAAFARLDALIREHEEFRQARKESPSGRRRSGKRVRRDPLCDDDRKLHILKRQSHALHEQAMDCDVARRLVGKVAKIGGYRT